MLVQCLHLCAAERVTIDQKDTVQHYAATCIAYVFRLQRNLCH